MNFYSWCFFFYYSNINYLVTLLINDIAVLKNEEEMNLFKTKCYGKKFQFIKKGVTFEFYKLASFFNYPYFLDN
jgi:hypothetical protein